MSKMVRQVIEQNLDIVTRQLSNTVSKSKKEFEDEIQELRSALPNLKSAAVKAAVTREIEGLMARMNAPVKPRHWSGHVAELKSLKDGYEKILAVMSNIPWYTDGMRGGNARKFVPPAAAGVAPAAKRVVKRRRRA